MMSRPPRMVIQQSMARIASFYPGSAATPPANHGDFFNTHRRFHQLRIDWLARSRPPCLDSVFSLARTSLRPVFDAGTKHVHSAPNHHHWGYRDMEREGVYVSAARTHYPTDDSRPDKRFV